MKMNVFCSGLILLCCLVLMASLTSTKVIKKVKSVSDNEENEAESGVPPILSYCSGNFMGYAYILRCMINTGDVEFLWTKNNEALYRNESKFITTKTGDNQFRILMLTIMDIEANDVGGYELYVFNNYGVAQERIWITPVEACDTLMRCYENPCVWPTKLSCKRNSPSKPRCVADMCSTDPNQWCKPKWFEGIEEVQCENDKEDDYMYNL